MKLLITLALIAVVVARPNDTYDIKYDNFNLEEVIENERLFQSYSRCFDGTGKCTAEGNQLKGWIPEAITTGCGKCTEKQRYLAAKAIIATKNKYPETYDTLKKMHNPDGKYDKVLAAFLAKYGS